MADMGAERRENKRKTRRKTRRSKQDGQKALMPLKDAQPLIFVEAQISTNNCASAGIYEIKRSWEGARGVRRRHSGGLKEGGSAETGFCYHDAASPGVPAQE